MRGRADPGTIDELEGKKVKFLEILWDGKTCGRGMAASVGFSYGKPPRRESENYVELVIRLVVRYSPLTYIPLLPVLSLPFFPPSFLPPFLPYLFVWIPPQGKLRTKSSPTNSFDEEQARSSHGFTGCSQERE